MNLMHELMDLQIYTDDRGEIRIAEPLPFTPLRAFILSNFNPDERRGEHALKSCHQVFIVASGKASFQIAYGEKSLFGITMSAGGTKILYIPPRAWRSVRGDRDTSIICLASTLYDPDDYISDWDKYCEMIS